MWLSIWPNLCEVCLKQFLGTRILSLHDDFQICPTCMFFDAHGTDHLHWDCVNILSEVGDAYSTGGAEAFKTAAVNNGIHVCDGVIHKYEANNVEETKAIFKKIMEDNCCYVNVVFDITKHLASLIQAARGGGYEGKWFVGNMSSEALDMVNELKNKLSEPSYVHEVLRGV